MLHHLLRRRFFATAVLMVLVFSAVTVAAQTSPAALKGKVASAGATVAEARAFVDAAEKRLLDIWIKDYRAQWLQQNFITDDTERIAADADQAANAATTELAAQATRFDKLKLPRDVARKLTLLRLSLDLPAPRNAAEQAELARVAASLQSDYGKGQWCPEGEKGKCLALGDMERILAESRDPNELLRVWKGWHAVGAPMRKR